ncbi:ABC transporter permease [Tardiphaga sp. 866_E4_N2_1]|uniref:ABC transporter permease n=1 Tax=unclassified Tardiphaga TaxID=2631404 RepID=UPI003F26E4C4
MSDVDAAPLEAKTSETENRNDDRHTSTVRLIPNRKIEGFGLDEIWAYRELIFGLLHRDLMAIKNQTPTAWFWRILQPTFTLITYTILFEHVGKVDFGSGIPYFFVMSAAMLPWQLISAVIQGAVSSIAANAGFFGKVYFPRIILPMVSVTNALVDFVVTSLLLLGLLFYMGMPLSLNLVMVPFFGMWALMLGIGVGLWLSALNSLYRDINQGLGYALQLAFFVSPIVYPSSVVPEQYREFYHLNPVVGIIEGFRWAFLQQGDPPDINDFVAFCATCLFVMSGMWAFRRVERVFADVI